MWIFFFNIAAAWWGLHRTQSSMSRVKGVEHSPEKEFCWVPPVRMFQKNIMVWVPFLSEVPSCCTLDFPGKTRPRHSSTPGAGRVSLSPQPGQLQACPRAHTPTPAGTEGSGDAMCNPWQDVAARLLAGPFVVVAASMH